MPTKPKGKAASSNPVTTDLPELPKQDALAIRIRTVRERQGLSFAELHRISGISKTSLHDYESGRTKPGAKELRTLCEVFQVTPNWLLFGTEEPYKPRTGLKALAKLQGSFGATMALMFISPLILASLDEDELESILVLLSSMVEAKDKKMYLTISSMAETLVSEFGSMSPQELQEASSRMSDPAYHDALAAKMQERLKETK